MGTNRFHYIVNKKTLLFPRTDQHFITAKYFLQLEEQKLRLKLHKNNFCGLFKISIQVLSTLIHHLSQYLTFKKNNANIFNYILKILLLNKAMKERQKSQVKTHKSKLEKNWWQRLTVENVRKAEICHVWHSKSIPLSQKLNSHKFAFKWPKTDH